MILYINILCEYIYVYIDSTPSQSEYINTMIIVTSPKFYVLADQNMKFRKDVLKIILITFMRKLIKRCIRI